MVFEEDVKSIFRANETAATATIVIVQRGPLKRGALDQNRYLPDFLSVTRRKTEIIYDFRGFRS